MQSLIELILSHSCPDCTQYLKRTGKTRTQEIEIRRQLVTAAQSSEAEGNHLSCHNCGRALDGDSENPAAMRRFSKSDGKARCSACYNFLRINHSDRPWHQWYGYEAFGALYSTAFMQWRSTQTLGEHECICGRQKVNWQGKRYDCRSCLRDPDAMDRWPAFHKWVNNHLVVAIGQSPRDVFMAVRRDSIYTSTTKRSLPHTTRKLAQAPEEIPASADNDNNNDKPFVLQAMAQPPGPGESTRRSTRSKKVLSGQ